MTRLVGVRAVCDGCSAAAAIVFCVSHRTVLCKSCESAQHAAPDTADHQRVALESAVTALPFCEYCDDAPATTYCESEGTTLCDKCDRVVHASHPLAHYRTSISSTLRNRAVEFRGKPRHKSGRKTQTPGAKNLGSETAELQTSQGEQQHRPQAVPSATPPASSAGQQKSSPSRRPPVPTTQGRGQGVSRKRSSKLLAKRKHRRDAEKIVTPTSAPHPSPDNVLPTSRPPDLVVSSEYPSSLFPMVSHSAELTTPPTHTAYAGFPMEMVSSGPVLSDPLLMDPNLQLRQCQERHTFAGGGSTYGHDLNSMVRYGTIDFSGDTALEGLNESGKSASGSASGASSRRQTPDFDALPVNGRVIQDRAHARGPPTSVAAVAAAAAAAGEMYLLNSVSSGSRSSRERLTPPLNDAHHVPNPAGVAEAATAAAAAAAGSASAGELGGAGVLPQAVLSSRPSHLATDAAAEALQQNSSWAGKSGALLRRASEPAIPTVAMNTGSEQWILAGQRQPVDEALGRLEVDAESSSRAVRLGTKGETSLNRHDQEVLTSQGESNIELLPPVTDGEDVLRRGSDAIGDLDMSRDEFGMFDSIDLSQFEHNASGSLPFSLHEYRSKPLDSDEG